MRKYAAGFAALLALLLILVGVPIVLIVAVGNPLPTGQQLDNILALTPDYGNAILVSKLLPMIGWIAWAFFAIPVLVEIMATIAGRTTRKRSPVFRAQQRVGATLIAAVLVMFAGTGVFVAPAIPAPASTVFGNVVSPSPRVLPATALAVAAAGSPGTRIGIARAGTADARVPATLAPVSVAMAPATITVTHTVIPGDTLWDIAEHYFGDGTRDIDIYHATTGTVQPDGSHLTDPNLIRPGWVLTVPGVAARAAPSAVAPGSTAHPALPTDTPPVHRQNHDQTQAVRGPSEPSPGRIVAPEPTRDNSHPVAETIDDGIDMSIPLITGSGLAGLLAAGVLVVLGRRRLVQRRRRAWGARIAMPESEGNDLEAQLRMIQDPVRLDQVDTALRNLQRWAEDTAGVLPDLFAVRLEGEEIALYLGAPALLPVPFTVSHQDHTIWTIRPADLGSPTPGTLAPYPALTTIGVDANGGVLLLNLENLGALNIRGDDRACRGFMDAIAAELASSPWADQVQVAMMGMPNQLGRSLNPSRVHLNDDIAAVLRNLRHDLDDRRAAFASLSVDNTRQARAILAGTEPWAPDILLIAQPLEADAERTVRELVNSSLDLGLVVLTQGGSENDWASVNLTSVDRAELLLPGRTVPGLPFTPQILLRRELDLLQQLVDTTTQASRRPPDHLVGSALNAPGEQPDPVLPVSLDPEQSAEARFIGSERDERVFEESPRQGWSAPYLRLLGPVDTLHLGDQEVMPRRGIELIAYLNLNGAVDGRQMQQAFWPDTLQAGNNQRQLATKVRVALGHTPDGRALLPENTQRHGYQLDRAIRSDWDDFQAYTGNDLATAATEALVKALRLVRGQPFANCNTRHWWHWIAIAEEEMIAAVLDTADELAARALTAHDHSTARFAAHIAQNVDPLNETGWRIQLRIAARTRDRAEFERILDDLYTQVGGDDPDYELDETTQQLVDRFLAQKSTTG